MKKLSYQLALQFPGDTLADFDALVELEELLTAEIEDANTVVDGHDSGSDESNIFIHTSQPAAAFARAKALLKKSNPKAMARLRAGFRKLNGNAYTVLWPEHLTEFSVK